MRDETSLAGEVLEKIPNKYMAVVVSSKRAKALNDGARLLVKSSASKPTTVALEEVAAGAVVPGTEKPKIESTSKEKDALPPPEDNSDTETEPETAAESGEEPDGEPEDDSDAESESEDETESEEE